MVLWLAYVPGFVFDRRAKAPPGDAQSLSLPPTDQIRRSTIRRVIDGGVLLLLLYVLLVNLIGALPNRFAQKLGPATRLPKLKQTWSLMNQPYHFIATLVVEAVLPDENKHRILPKAGAPSTLDFILAPDDIRIQRHHDAVIQDTTRHNYTLARPFCAWQLRRWNDTHAPDQQATGIRLSVDVEKLPAFDAEETLAGWSPIGGREEMIIFEWPESSSPGPVSSPVR